MNSSIMDPNAYTDTVLRLDSSLNDTLNATMKPFTDSIMNGTTGVSQLLDTTTFASTIGSLILNQTDSLVNSLNGSVNNTVNLL